MCYYACIQTQRSSILFWTDLVLETFEKTRTARLYFHMQIAAKLSFQLGSSLGCRRRGINRLSEGQWQRYGSSSGKTMVQGTKKNVRLMPWGTIREHQAPVCSLLPASPCINFQISRAVLPVLAMCCLANFAYRSVILIFECPRIFASS